MSFNQGSRFNKLGRNGNGNGNKNFGGVSESETDVSTSTENLSPEDLDSWRIRHMERQEPQGQEYLPPSNRTSTCSYNTLIIHQDSHHLDNIPDHFLNESQVLKHLAKEVKTSVPREEPPRPRSLRREKLQLSKSQPDLRSVGNNGTLTRRSRNSKTDLGIIESLRNENSRLRLELESYIQKLSKTEKLEEEFTKVHRAQEELVQSSDRRGRLEREARTRLQADCRRIQDMNRALRDQVELLSMQVLSTRVPTGDALRRELSNRDLLITQLIASNKELSACKERQDIELAAQRATLQEQRTHIDILDTALTNAQSNVVRLEEECRKKQMYVDLVSQLKQALVNQQQASDRREQTEHMLRLQLERELRAERAKSSASDNASAYGSNNGSSCGTSGLASGESTAELKRKLREKEEKIMMLEGENAKWEQRYIEESTLRHAAIEAASLPKDAKIAALEKTSQETERLILEARTEKMRHIDEQHLAQKRAADLEARVKDLESRLAERDAMIKVLHKHTYEPSCGFSDLARQDLSASNSVFSSVSSALTASTGFTSYSGCSDSSNKLFHSSSYHPVPSVSDASGKLSYHGGDSASKLSFGGESSSKLSFSGDSYHGHSHASDTNAQISNYGSFRGQFSSGQSFDETKKSLDDQLKELDSQLDSQLLSKRGLCCFPGFSNSGTAPRKGKISQPLLASVAGLENAGGFLGGLVRTTEAPARPEEMMLLEKQGRSSQRQRAGSLPPSSLPRPRRARKLGEYGRLSDSEAARKASTDDDNTGSLRYDREHKMSDEPLQRPPHSPSSFAFTRFKTPPVESRKCDYSRKTSSGDETPPRTPSTPTKIELPSFPRLKTPPEGPFSRKISSKESSPVGTGAQLGRYKTQQSLDSSKELDCGKKSFIPPPRKLGEYGRLSAARSSSDSTSGNLTPTVTPNYRIRF